MAANKLTNFTKVLHKTDRASEVLVFDGQGNTSSIDPEDLVIGTATKLENPVQIDFQGDIQGALSFNGSEETPVVSNITVKDNSHNHTVDNVSGLRDEIDSKVDVADYKNSDVKLKYESNADTNAFTDSEKSKLSGIEAGAEVNTVNSVLGQVGDVDLDTDDIAEGLTNQYFTTERARDSISVSGDLNYSGGVISFNETYSAPSEVKTAYESNADTNAFTDSEKSKLSTVETGAEVNTVNSVSGKVGDVVLDTDDISEGLTNQYFTTDRAREAISVSGDLNYSDGVISFNETYSTPSEVKTAYESNSDTNAFTDSEKSKLSGIEFGAEVNTVNSVNGYSGNVSLDKSDVGLSSVTNDVQLKRDSNLLDVPNKSFARTNLGLAEVAATGNFADMSGEVTESQLSQELAEKVNDTLPYNLDASTAPTANDDINAGWKRGSLWIDTTSQKAYRCVDNTSGAAVWVDTSLSTSELAAVALSGSYNDLNNRPSNATETVSGFMSASDKVKLNTVETGAEVNTVNSVAGKTGLVTLSTSDVSEGTNQYFTTARARNSISVSGDLTYSNGTISFNETYSTPTDIKTAYESNTNTNAFTDSEKSKLSGIESGAEVNTVNSVAGKTGSVTLSTSDVSEGTNQYFTTDRARAAISVSGDLTYSNGTISFNETYSTPTDIKTAYESNADTNAFTDSEKSKLSGIEAGAEVNEPTNLGSSRTSVVYNVSSSTGSNTSLQAATTTLAGVMTASDKAKLDSVEEGAGVSNVDSVNGQTGTVSLSTDNIPEGNVNDYFTIARARNSISVSGDLNYSNGVISFDETYSTPSEVKTAYESNANTNAFTDSEKSKLSGIEAGAEVNDVEEAPINGSQYARQDGGWSVLDIPEGYTSANFNADFSSKSTDDLSEGVSNLYYSDARVQSAVDGQFYRKDEDIQVRTGGHVGFGDFAIQYNAATKSLDFNWIGG